MQIFMTLTNVVQVAAISGIVGAIIGAVITLKFTTRNQKKEN
jgi:uncharacterized membrane-anchored protein YhcB (DUF1043 family)